MPSKAALGPVVAVLSLLSHASASGTAASLTFCVGLGNPPLSGGSTAGIETDLAHELAERLGADTRFAWLELYTESLEQAVLEGRCDAGMGALSNPDLMTGERRVPGVGLTRSYYSAGYALIRRADARPARSLAELGRERIAVEKVSIPVFTLRQRGHQVHVVDDSRAVIAALRSGRAAYGYLWSPIAGWLLREHRDVIIAEEFLPVDLWDFGIAVRTEDKRLRAALDGAIARLIEDGVVAKVFSRYNVPYFRPVPR